MEKQEPRWWRVGIDAIFANTESPPGSMDSRETSSTICTHGFLYTKARNLNEAREKAVSLIKKTYLEPLLNVAYLNTCPAQEYERKTMTHLPGLTLRQ